MTGAEEEYEERLTVLGALRWFRDSFAAWFATAWLYIILWAVVAGAFGVLMYIDGKFSRGLAEGASIDPLSFQIMGWVYRLFAAAFLMAAARCAYKNIQGKWTFRLLGVFASVIVCLHAFGFGFEALADRRDQAMAARTVATLAETNHTDQIAALERQKDGIRADRDADVERLQASIQGIVSDGLNNDELADVYRQDQTRITDEARAKLATLDAQILGLMQDANTAQTSGVQIQAETRPWAPLFIGMAQLFTWEREPTDWAIYLCAVGFIIFWVLLGESLVIFLPERIYSMHLKDAESKPKDVVPEDGKVIIKMTEQEAAEMQAALEAYGRRREGDKKGADTRQRKNRQDAKRLEANQYMEARKERVLRMRLTGASVAEIAKKLGVTPSVLGLEMRQWMTDAEYAFVFEGGPNPYGENDEDLAARA
jgi:transposase-like protein